VYKIVRHCVQDCQTPCTRLSDTVYKIVRHRLKDYQTPSTRLSDTVYKIVRHCVQDRQTLSTRLSDTVYNNQNFNEGTKLKLQESTFIQMKLFGNNTSVTPRNSNINTRKKRDLWFSRQFFCRFKSSETIGCTFG